MDSPSNEHHIMFPNTKDLLFLARLATVVFGYPILVCFLTVLHYYHLDLHCSTYALLPLYITSQQFSLHKLGLNIHGMTLIIPKPLLQQKM